MTYSNGFDAYSRRSARMRYRARPRIAARAPIGRRPSRLGAPFARMRASQRIAVLAVLAAALAAAAWLAGASLSGMAGGSADAGSGAPQSTPRREWRAGEVPELYQRDAAWASERYGEDDLAESGCGPVCMAMVYVALTGRDDRGPVEMAALSERMGCVSPDGTAWTFMTEGAAAAGLAAEELPADELSVRRALLGGSFVICSMGPGDFTTTGHFIVLAGIDEHRGLVVRDPNSPERTARSWDFDVVLGQARNLWAYRPA